VPAGGTTGQVLEKASGTDYDTDWVTPTGGGGGDVATDTIWDAKGDLALGTGADTAARLPVGSNGQILTADPALTLGVKWANPQGVSQDLLWDSKGDLAVATGADTASKLPVGTNGQVLVADSTQSTGVKWAALTSGGAGILPPHLSGYWYTTPFSTAYIGSVSIAKSTMHALPFLVPTDTTYDRIAVICTSPQASTTYRLGIYADSNGYPGSLILDAGTVATTTSGERSITISQALTAGQYWLAGVAQGTGTNPGVSGQTVNWLFHTSQTLTNLNSVGSGGAGLVYQLGSISASLPSPFTAGAIWANTATAMRVFVRAA
jgi:hypothetical protein